MLVDLVWVREGELWLVIAQLCEAGDPELGQGGLELLQHVGPDLRLPVTALDLDNFQDSEE